MTEPGSSSNLSIAEIEAKLRDISGADWARARNLARLCASGLTDWFPEDLLNEALVKLLSGERNWRSDVPALVTLKTIMRSIASNERKKVEKGPIDKYRSVDVGIGYSAETDDALPLLNSEDVPDPAEIVDDRDQLAYIEKLVDGDKEAGEVLAAWCIGLRGEEAIKELGYDIKQYEAARKRLTDKLRPAAAMRKIA